MTMLRLELAKYRRNTKYIKSPLSLQGNQVSEFSVQLNHDKRKGFNLLDIGKSKKTFVSATVEDVDALGRKVIQEI